MEFKKMIQNSFFFKGFFKGEGRYLTKGWGRYANSRFQKRYAKGKFAIKAFIARPELDACLFFHFVYHRKIIFGHNQESFQKTNDQNEKEIVGGLHISVEVQEDILFVVCWILNHAYESDWVIRLY